MQADRREHRHQRPVGDFQILDEVEAVQFGVAGGHGGQVPALGRSRPTQPAHAVERAVARQHAGDGGPRRHRLLLRLPAQREADGIRAVFTQDAVAAQAVAQLHDAPLQFGRTAVPRPAGVGIAEVDPIEPPAGGPPHPVGDRADAHAEGGRHGAQAATRAHGANGVAAAVLDGAFLPMIGLPNAGTLSQRRAASAPPPVAPDRTPAAARRRARGKLRSPYGLPALAPREKHDDHLLLHLLFNER